MRVHFLVALLFSSLFLVQSGPTDVPAVLVLKFHCGRYEQGSGMIRSVQDPGGAMNEPISIQQTRNEPQEIKNRRDMQERRAEMQATEINAARSSQPQSKLYVYQVGIL